jgi:predicted HAD superfamily Cof-like phosphohydrolase
MTDDATELALAADPIEKLEDISPKENLGVVYGSPVELVREFHETYGQAIRLTPTLDIPERKLRVALVEEEFTEYRDAEADDDLVEIADALGDIVWVCYGAALAHGIDLDQVLLEISRSNMSKLGEDGKPIYITEGPKKGKVVKGPNFSEPDLTTVLKLQGWTGE